MIFIVCSSKNFLEAYCCHFVCPSSYNFNWPIEFDKRWTFIFQGCLQGDAAGIKLSSFERLMEVKSGVPNQSLLHHLVKVANDNDAMLKFIPEMGQLDKISL